MKYIKLTTPDGKELEFVIEPVVTAKGGANHAKVNEMDVIQGSQVVTPHVTILLITC
jgi:hypothetical protein